LTRVGYSPAGLNSIFSFPVVRIADEHLRQNGVCTGFVKADAILPKGHYITLGAFDLQR
jgi:hypothetical protein